MRKQITINARKFDGHIHRSWQAELLSAEGPLLTLVGVFNNEVSHPELGVIRRGTMSYEYYWLDRWYNVFRFHEPDGRFRNFYCNVNIPPVLSEHALDYIDLDLDLLIDAHGTITLLDAEEFEQNALSYGYDEEIKLRASQAIEELRRLAGLREFPFCERLPDLPAVAPESRDETERDAATTTEVPTV